MALYTIRPSFTVEVNGIIYVAGQQVDLDAVNFEVHKHKLEGVQSNVVPLNLSNSLLNFDDSQAQLGASSYQEAIAHLDTRVDEAEADIDALSDQNTVQEDAIVDLDTRVGTVVFSAANTIKGRLVTDGDTQNLSKLELQTLLGNRYYHKGQTYPDTRTPESVWTETDGSGGMISNWYQRSGANPNFWYSDYYHSHVTNNILEITNGSNILIPVRYLDNVNLADTQQKIFLQDFLFSYRIEQNNNNSNYWQINFYKVNYSSSTPSNTIQTLLFSTDTTNGLLTRNAGSKSGTINTEHQDFLYFLLDFIKVGNPGKFLNFGGTLRYRWAKLYQIPFNL